MGCGDCDLRCLCVSNYQRTSRACRGFGKGVQVCSVNVSSFLGWDGFLEVDVQEFMLTFLIPVSIGLVLAYLFRTRIKKKTGGEDGEWGFRANAKREEADD